MTIGNGHFPGCQCGLCVGALTYMAKKLNPSLEQAPIVNRFDNGAVFRGSGNSHFTVDNQKFHETTFIPGFGKAEGLDNGLSVHLPINENW